MMVWPFMREQYRSGAASPDAPDTGGSRLAGVMQTPERGIEGILTSDGFTAYLRTMARFPTYSVNNTLLILAQRPDATQVAGYRRWQELGRQVMKGETGIKILVPHKTRLKLDQDDP